MDAIEGNARSKNKRKGRLEVALFQTISGLKMNEQLMTVDHFGSGGRRSDSRLGRRGKKLGDCGIVGLWDCGEIAISEISGFFMFFLI